MSFKLHDSVVPKQSGWVDYCLKGAMRISTAIFNNKSVPQLVTCLLLLDCFFCLAYSVTHLIPPFSVEPSSLWNLDSEASIASWYSVLKYLGVSLLSAWFVRREVTTRPQAAVGLPIMFLAMGIDEGARLHERIGKYSDVFLPGGSRANIPFHETGIWMFIVGIPFIVVFLLWVNRLKRELTRYSADILLLTTGMVVLLSGALGVELLSNFVYGLTWKVAVALEEGFEMLGLTVMCWAVCNMLRRQRLKLIRG